MSKQRNSDTEIWRDPWHRMMPAEYKCFWKYLCDNCDDAGVWKKDLDLAIFQIRAGIYEEKALLVFNEGKERVLVFKPGYWFLTGFLDFHYPGGLSTDSGFHKKIIGLLHQHGLEGHISPYLGVKDKYKDKGKEKTHLKEKGYILHRISLK